MNLTQLLTRKGFSFLFKALGLIALLPHPSFAQLPPQIEKSRAWQLIVQKAKKIQNYSNPNNTSQSMLIESPPAERFREWTRGQSWTIVAISLNRTENFFSETPLQLKKRKGIVGCFRYTVADVKTDPPRIQVKITPLSPMDSRVQFLELGLTTSGKLEERIQIQKTLHLLDDLKQPFELPLSLDALPSGMSPVENFPLDWTDLRLASSAPVRNTPEIPTPLEAYLKHAALTHIPRESMRLYETDDFFGRAIEVIWSRKSPWPLYTRSPLGITLLLEEDHSS